MEAQSDPLANAAQKQKVDIIGTVYADGGNKPHVCIRNAHVDITPYDKQKDGLGSYTSELGGYQISAPSVPMYRITVKAFGLKFEGTLSKTGDVIKMETATRLASDSLSLTIIPRESSRPRFPGRSATRIGTRSDVQRLYYRRFCSGSK